MFSIIIPTFNSEKTLRAALASVVSQTFQEFEIIIIDGLSTDETLQIAEEFKKVWQSIKIRSEKDEGIYDAMNKGIVMATGEWLYFLGSDDKLHDDEVLNEISKQIADNPQFKVFYGNALIVGDAGWADNNRLYDGNFSTSKLLTKNISHQAIFYHSSVFKNLGSFDTRYRTCADYDFNLRAWAHYKFFYLDLIISKFYSGGFSTEKQEDDAFSNDYVKNVITYFMKQLYKKPFENFELEILKFATSQFIKFKIFKSLYLYCTAYRFRISRKLKLNA